MTEIERSTGARATVADQVGWLIGRVRYDAQPVLAVKLSRLRRNIAGRKPVVQIRLLIRALHVGDHLSVPIRIEPVDENAIEAGKAPDLMGDRLVCLFERRGALYGLDEKVKVLNDRRRSSCR